MNESDSKAFSDFVQSTGNVGDGARQAWQAALIHRDKQAGDSVAMVVGKFLDLDKNVQTFIDRELPLTTKLYTAPPAVAQSELDVFGQLGVHNVERFNQRLNKKQPVPDVAGLLGVLQRAESAMTWELGGEPCGLQRSLLEIRATLQKYEQQEPPK